MPGLTPDQVYTYPAKRWRKKRRSYLVTYTQSPKKKEPLPEGEVGEVPPPIEPASVVVSTLVPINEDSKDSSVPAPLSTKDEASKVCRNNGIIYLVMSCSFLWFELKFK